MDKEPLMVRCKRENRNGPLKHIAFYDAFLINAEKVAKFDYQWLSTKGKDGKLDRNNTQPFWEPKLFGFPFRISEYEVYSDDAKKPPETVKILETLDIFSTLDGAKKGTPVEFYPVLNIDTVVQVGEMLRAGRQYIESPWTKEAIQALKRYIIFNGLHKYFNDDEPLNGCGYWYIVREAGLTYKIIYDEGEFMFDSWLSLDVAGDELRRCLGFMGERVGVSIQNAVISSLMDRDGKLTEDFGW